MKRLPLLSCLAGLCLAFPLSAEEPIKASEKQNERIQRTLKLIPEDASGFVVVNQFRDIEKKYLTLREKLKDSPKESPFREGMWQEMMKSLPMDLMKAGTDNAVVVFFEPHGELKDPSTVWILPNYRELIRAHKVKQLDKGFAELRDANDKTWLVTTHQQFALVGKPEHRASLMKIQQSTKSIAESTRIQADWLAEWDVVGVALREGWANHFGPYAANTKNPEPKEIDTAWTDFQNVIRKNVAQFAVAGRLREDGTVHTALRVISRKDSEFFKALSTARKPESGLLAQLPDEPYVFAGVADIPERFEQKVTDYLKDFVVQAMRKEGVERTDEVAKLFETMKKLEEQATSMGYMVHAPANLDKVQGTRISGFINVKDSATFVRETKDWIMSASKLATPKLAGPLLKEQPLTGEGISGVLLVTPKRENEVEPMYEGALALISLGPKRVAFGAAFGTGSDGNQATKLTHAYRTKGPELSGNKTLKKVAALLPSGSHEEAYLNVGLLFRMMGFTGAAEAIGEELPPLAMASEYTQEGMDMHLLLPIRMLTAMERMSFGAGSAPPKEGDPQFKK